MNEELLIMIKEKNDKFFCFEIINISISKIVKLFNSLKFNIWRNQFLSMNYKFKIVRFKILNRKPIIFIDKAVLCIELLQAKG